MTFPTSPKKPLISLIAAIDADRAIGYHNQLPWHLPDDLKFFKTQTQGGTIVMGRKTFESLGSKPLPKRRNIVLTQQKHWTQEGVEVAHSWNQLLEQLTNEALEQIWIIGGGEIYQHTLMDASELILTQVHTRLTQADTWFPEWSQQEWTCQETHPHPQDERHAFAFDWQKWVRISPN